MTPKLLLFDDVLSMRQAVTNALRTALKGHGQVQEFKPNDVYDIEGTYEAKLAADLNLEPNRLATLIVADQDLSRYAPKYTGLSEFTVRQVATELGIPQCGYARGAVAGGAFLERGDQQESCIRLELGSEPYDKFAQRVVAVDAGFREIGQKIALLKTPSLRSPGQLLADCLGVPEYAPKITLYASGDRNRLASVPKKNAERDLAIKKVVCFLGYWLWDSVLRFPGITVGKTAASSYLNIDADEFEKHSDIQDVFADAKYKGPFADAKVPMWWRGKLDDLIAQSGKPDGRELASKILSREVRQSSCSVDPRQKAGYYCMLTEKQVSLENSVPGLPWFPRGADLARISKNALDELGPWI